MLSGLDILRSLLTLGVWGVLVYYGLELALAPERYRDRLIRSLDKHPVMRVLHDAGFWWPNWRESRSYLLALRVAVISMLILCALSIAGI